MKYCVFPAIALIIYLLLPVPEDWVVSDDFISVKVLDRNGTLLREFLSSWEAVSSWVPLEEVSPWLIRATIASEDKRFYHHPGVDPIAIARAIYLNIKEKRIVSGGSTITQQLARTLHNWKRRNVFYKILETLEAIRLELHLSKDEILEAYLNRTYYGNQTYGVGAASWLYFRKPPSHLSLAESAFLAAIPRAPSVFNPYVNLEGLLKRRDSILKLMLKRNQITRSDYLRAIREPLNLVPKEVNFKAPHFVQWVMGKLEEMGLKGISEVRTTLDYALQRRLEQVVRDELSLLKAHRVTNAALIVLDTRTGELLCMIGSRDFFDQEHDGQVNGATSLRQPGSTLKPFTYGVALEDRVISPATLIPDIETHISETSGDFFPKNYDRKYHGPVRARTALACSYNVSAVRVLNELGPERLLKKLHEAGFQSLNKPADFYGLGLTLGNGEVTLLELTRAYRAIARYGQWEEEKVFIQVKDKEGKLVHLPRGQKRRIFSPGVAYILTDILSDEKAKLPAFSEWNPLELPFQCASKTGTSKDFRDNWTVGYTTDFTVGVWVGNFDGSPMQGISGIAGAGPIFRGTMLILHEGGYPSPFPEPPGLIHLKICPASGQLPGPYCPHTMDEVFIPGTEPREVCTVHRLYRIDVRNGLLASEDTPAEYVEERVYEVYPPEYHQWMMKKGLPLPPVTHSDLDVGEGLSVIFPDDGDVFKIDPILRRPYQKIKLRASVPSAVEKVCWIIDGERVGEVGFPYTLEWTLKPGRHLIKVKTEEEESRPVEITVLR